MITELLVMVLGGFGLLLVITAIIVTSSQRKNRLQLRRLKGEVARLNDQLRTAEERKAEAKRIEAIEANKREIHGRFDSGGC